MFLSSLCVLQFVAKIKNKVDRKTVVMSNKDAPLGFLPDSEPDLAKKKLHTIKHMGGRKKKKTLSNSKSQNAYQNAYFLLCKKQRLALGAETPTFDSDRQGFRTWVLPVLITQVISPFWQKKTYPFTMDGEKNFMPINRRNSGAPISSSAL